MNVSTNVFQWLDRVGGQGGHGPPIFQTDPLWPPVHTVKTWEMYEGELAAAIKHLAYNETS